MAFSIDVTDFTYSHLGQGDGLCSQRIYSILHTSDGALWWATKNGVERYNGVAVNCYSLEDSNRPSDRAGRTIKLKTRKTNEGETSLTAFDDKGYIYSYDPIQDRFVQKVSLSRLMHGDVLFNDILEESDGIWLAMREGIFYLKGQALIPVCAGCTAFCIVWCDGLMLFGTDKGVLAYNHEYGKTPKKDVRMRVVLPDHVETGYYDAFYRQVWMGCFHGGVKVAGIAKSREGKKLSGEWRTVNGLSENPVRSICPYNQETMLIGVDGSGVWWTTRRPTVALTTHLLFDANEGVHGVLHGNGIYSLLKDSWDNIVIGSYSGGIDIARPVGSTPAIYQHGRGHDQSLLNDRVNCVAQMSSGNLMMGTDNGISVYDQKAMVWRHICKGAVVIDLCKTDGGSILAATYGKGVLEITPSGDARQRYSKVGGILRDDHVYSLFYDRMGSLWMGCLDGDLVQVLPTGTCNYYQVNNVHDIVQTADGRIAVATANGIQLIEPRTGKVSSLEYGGQKDDVNLYVNTLYVDRQKIWIGTDGGGIYVYDFAARTSTNLTTANGLPSDFISSICKDGKGRVLVATERGLAFIDPSAPAQVVDVNYCFGLGREYSVGAACLLANGNVLYGSTTGALVINPANIQKINYRTELNLLGVSCGDSNDPKFRQQVFQMLERRQLELAYGQRTFVLYFESINLRNQYDIVYQYRIEDGEWSLPSAQQYIRFDNMEPGKHLLVLRSVSRTCGETLDEVRLTVIIGQPWWNTWWMWCVYLCLLAMAFYGVWSIYRLHTKYMRLVVLHASGKRVEEQHEQPVAKGENDEQAAFINKATQLVVEHVGESDFTIDALCREMAMSRTLFYLRLKSYTGKSPQDFIRVIRLERAAALLRGGSSVTDAAALSGFDNPKYFSTVFKKYFGMSPSRYR